MEQRSSWVKLFGLGIVGAIAAPLVVAGILAKRRLGVRVTRIVGSSTTWLTNQRHAWCSEFTIYEFLSGNASKRSRR